MKKFSILFGIVMTIFVAYYYANNPGKKLDSTTSESEFAALLANLPADQSEFLKIVRRGQSESKLANNDTEKVGARADRESAICGLLGQLAVTDWIGKVDTLTLNSDGKSVIVIEIARHAYVKTYNNTVSDILSEARTLIQPGTDLFNKAAQLREGQRVKFSGTFIRDSSDSGGCIEQGSLTINGKLAEPEFIFRFSDIGPA